VVDVQMRMHDEVNLVGGPADPDKLVQKPRARARHERARLRPKPCVDEHRRPASTDQNGADRQPPLLVAAQRRECLRDGREASLGVDEDGDVECADSQSGNGLRPPNPSSTRCQ
jgi:hypothetical protein